MEWDDEFRQKRATANGNAKEFLHYHPWATVILKIPNLYNTGVLV